MHVHCELLLKFLFLLLNIKNFFFHFNNCHKINKKAEKVPQVKKSTIFGKLSTIEVYRL